MYNEITNILYKKKAVDVKMNLRCFTLMLVVTV